MEINTVITFLNDAALGQLSNRTQDANAFPAFPDGFFERRWFTGNSMPTSIWGLPPGGFDTPVPYQRLYETLGSGSNRECFFLLQAAINYAKSEVSYLPVPIISLSRKSELMMVRNRHGDGVRMASYCLMIL